MFEKAIRAKLRFVSAKGPLTIEDLWDLPLTSTTGKPNLDDIAKGLYRQLKSGDDVSFVHVAQKSDATVQLSFDIVKHIIDVRIAENEYVRQSRVRAEKRQQLMEAIERKEQGALEQTSLEDLRKMLDTL